ncbi:MAG: site-specific integrase, partial [Pseudomonadota bacterium]
MSLRWVATFLDAQAAERGAAENTLLSYGRDLRAFCDWCTDNGHALETLSQTEVEAYLLTLDAQGLAKSTRARRLSAIKQLFRFAYDEGWRDTNPAMQIAGPGKTKRLPK